MVYNFPKMFVLHQCRWIGGSLFCAVTLVCGFWKMRINEFPLFFVFLAWKVVGFLVLFRFRYVQSGTLWGWCVLSLIEISFVLEVLLLYKMAAMLIFSHSSLAKRLRPLPAGVLAGLILCAAVVAALTPTASSFPLIRALHQMSVSQDFIEVGLLLALFLITGLVGLSWKALATGVALGWGISSAVNICAMFLLGRLGQSFYCQRTHSV